MSAFSCVQPNNLACFLSQLQVVRFPVAYFSLCLFEGTPISKLTVANITVANIGDIGFVCEPAMPYWSEPGTEQRTISFWIRAYMYSIGGLVSYSGTHADEWSLGVLSCHAVVGRGSSCPFCNFDSTDAGNSFLGTRALFPNENSAGALFEKRTGIATGDMETQCLGLPDAVF